MLECVLKLAEVAGTWGIVIAIVRESRALIHQHRMDAFRMILDRLQDEPVRQARRSLFEARDKGLPSDPADWNNAVVKAAEIASSRFDEIGVLLDKKALDEDLLLPNWAPSICKSWEAAKPLIEYQRKHFDHPDRWRGFQSLAQRAEKSKAASAPSGAPQ